MNLFSSVKFENSSDVTKTSVNCLFIIFCFKISKEETNSSTSISPLEILSFLNFSNK